MTNRRIRVGTAEIVALVDAVPPPVEPSWSFPAVPPALWAGRSDGSLDPEGRFRPNLGCFLVRIGGVRVLVDTGIGPGPNAYLSGVTGTLPRRLADEGLSFADIDLVAFTHLHMDHVGWTMQADGRPSCPNALHVVGAEELAFWMGAPTTAGAHHRAAFEASIRPLALAGRIREIVGRGDIGHGLSFWPAPGHTPGHCAIAVASGNATAVITGDVFHCPAQVAEPGWSHRADMDAASAERSRRRFIDEATVGAWQVAAGHFRDGCNFGRIERAGAAAVWTASGGAHSGDLPAS